MRKLALAAALAVSTVGAAEAADLPSVKDPVLPGYVAPKATDDWTGPHIGIHGGYAWGDWNGTLRYMGGEAGYKDDDRSLGATGWLGGLQVGYDRQTGKIVLGVEADVSYTNFNGVETYVTDAPTESDKSAADGDYAKKHDFSMDWFGTVRGRLGYSFGRFLPYVTGGLAWATTNGDLTISYPNSDTTDVSMASADETHIGWVIGGGLDTDLGRGWSLRAEYLHVELGDEGYWFKGKVYNGAPFNTDSFPADLKFDVVRAGINYRF